MKKFIFTGLVAVMSIISAGCNNKSGAADKDDISVSAVPAAVQSSFSSKYPGATDVQWENATEDGKKTYKVKFMQNGEKMKVEFDEDGTFIKVDDN